MLTEQSNPRTRNIDSMSALEIIQTINEQDKQVALAIERALPNIAAAIDAITERFRRGGRLFYVGAGTSGRLGVLDAVECLPTYGTPPEMVQGLLAGGDKALTRSVEGAEDSPEGGKADLLARNLSADDSVVGIAASGTTPYVLGALKYAEEIAALRVGISCNQPSPLLESAEYPIALLVGAEVITGSTRMKAGSAQKMVLNMISTASMVRLGKVYGNLMVDVQVTNEKLARRAASIVSEITGTDTAVAQALLEQAGNSVKLAIVMHKRQVTHEEALALLEAADGHLRRVID